MGMYQALQLMLQFGALLLMLVSLIIAVVSLIAKKK